MQVMILKILEYLVLIKGMEACVFLPWKQFHFPSQEWKWVMASMISESLWTTKL